MGAVRSCEGDLASQSHAPACACTICVFPCASLRVRFLKQLCKRLRAGSLSETVRISELPFGDQNSEIVAGILQIGPTLGVHRIGRQVYREMQSPARPLVVQAEDDLAEQIFRIDPLIFGPVVAVAQKIADRKSTRLNS